ncbi:MAG: hypothetical protein ACOYNO_02040 [Saprospiraceae bacterium]
MRLQAALAWIRQSFKATGSQGSSHSFSPVFGWAKAYPETSGYLVETLLRAAALPGQSDLYDLSVSCLRWLCNIQLPNGAFTGLMVGHSKPSVFNTAQILFGFAAGLSDLSIGNASERAAWHASSTRALDWLLQQRQPKGGWAIGAYMAENPDPTYYTRLLWGMLQMADVLHRADAVEVVQAELLRYAQRFTPQHSVLDWGFWPDQPAHTHTIAYTLEGFWQVARRLQEQDIMAQTVCSVDVLLQKRALHGRTAGTYDDLWHANLRYRCVTGNLQLSILCGQMGKALGRADLSDAAQSLFDEVAAAQCRLPWSPVYGAIPGSMPFWGPYLRGRFPNWAAKFWVDALMALRED